MLSTRPLVCFIYLNGEEDGPLAAPPPQPLRAGLIVASQASPPVSVHLVKRFPIRNVFLSCTIVVSLRKTTSNYPGNSLELLGTFPY